MRPKLLFLCQTLPYPPDGGVEIRSYNILRLLARSFDVTGLFFVRSGTRPDREAVAAGLEGLAKHAASSAFPIPQEHSRIRLVWDHLRSTVTRRPYTYYAYDSTEFAFRLRQVLQHQSFDMVHVDSLDLSRYLPMLKDIPIACTHHNIESDLLRRRAETEANPFMGRYLRLQSHLMEAEERRWCGDFAVNVTVSVNDCLRLKQIVPSARVVTVPNGVDTEAFQPAAREQSGIVFVGGFGWYPNRDGMKFFAEKILPLVRQHRPGVEVTWVGRAPEDMRREYELRLGVSLTGYVEDVRPYVHSAACYIVPLRSGGGTRLKILDAWALGKAVVSTRIGCEGIEAKDGDNILIRDDPQGFAEAVIQLLEDERARAKLGRSARRTAEEVYDWEIVGRELSAAYSSVMESP